MVISKLVQPPGPFYLGETCSETPALRDIVDRRALDSKNILDRFLKGFNASVITSVTPACRAIQNQDVTAPSEVGSALSYPHLAPVSVVAASRSCVVVGMLAVRKPSHPDRYSPRCRCYPRPFRLAANRSNCLLSSRPWVVPDQPTAS